MKCLRAFSSNADPVIWHDKSNRLLAFAGIGQAHHSRLFYPGKLVEDFLNFARIYIDAIDQDHVLFTVGDVIIALVVAVANVAGQQPPIAE